MIVTLHVSELLLLKSLPTENPISTTFSFVASSNFYNSSFIRVELLHALQHRYELYPISMMEYLHDYTFDLYKSCSIEICRSSTGKWRYYHLRPMNTHEITEWSFHRIFPIRNVKSIYGRFRIVHLSASIYRKYINQTPIETPASRL